MIEIKNLQKQFDGEVVIDNVSFTIKDGEKVVIIGPSGSGKSTFLRCMNLLATPDSGEILIDGVNLLDSKT